MPSGARGQKDRLGTVALGLHFNLLGLTEQVLPTTVLFRGDRLTFSRSGCHSHTSSSRRSRARASSRAHSLQKF